MTKFTSTSKYRGIGERGVLEWQGTSVYLPEYCTTSLQGLYLVGTIFILLSQYFGTMLRTYYAMNHYNHRLNNDNICKVK